MVVAILLAILGPIMARLLYFAISRKREFLADASAVRLTRYPEGLASALEKISGTHMELASANKVTAPMYIINPLKKKGAQLSALSSTHPPIHKRIKILRSMAHGVNFLNYNHAYANVMGKSGGVMPASGLKDRSSIPMREPSVETTAQTAKKQKRDLGDLVRAVNQYAFLACVCGMKFKIPPDFKKSTISCPRCKRENKVPIGQMTAMAAGLGAVIGDKPGGIQDQLKSQSEAKPQEPMKYKRKGKSWETFNCRCGNAMQLSPAFSGTRMFCRKCGARIDIET
jgi:heat shock protein HtpX